MGYWKKGRKGAVEDFKAINNTLFREYKNSFRNGSFGHIRWTNRRGEETGIVGFQVFLENLEGKIRFLYARENSVTSDTENMDYSIKLVSTPCFFGEKRWWFICPLTREGRDCRRRVGKLYLGRRYFGCRHCYELTYRSSQEHDDRINRLARNPDLLLQTMNNPNPRKALLAIKAYYKTLLRINEQPRHTR